MVLAKREKCLRGRRTCEFIVLHLLLAAVLPEPGLRLQDLTSAFIFPHTGAKKTQRKGRKLYIYNYIYI